MDSYTTYATVSLRMTSSDVELLSRLLDDTKRRAVSLRHLSFLYNPNLVIFCPDIKVE